MALYSGSLKTSIIDDLSFNQNKIEFRFDRDTMYYSNLRLVDLGVKGTATKYNGLSGVYGSIKHIALLDGRQKLDELRFANRYLALNNLLATNAANYKAPTLTPGVETDEQKAMNTAAGVYTMIVQDPVLYAKTKLGSAYKGSKGSKVTL